MLSRSAHLLLPRRILQAMVEHAQAELPNECCGLLAGEQDGEVLRVEAWHALVNALASPTKYLSDGANAFKLDAHEDVDERLGETRYLSDGPSMFKADRAMREAGHEILAVYHSHPTSEPIPSRTDLDWEYFSDVIHFIIGMSGPAPLVRAWWLSKTAFEEAKWEIVEVDEPVPNREGEAPAEPRIDGKPKVPTARQEPRPPDSAL